MSEYFLSLECILRIAFMQTLCMRDRAQIDDAACGLENEENQ